MCLANPPFGRKYSNLIVTEDGGTEREQTLVVREDFLHLRVRWGSTNREFRWVLHDLVEAG